MGQPLGIDLSTDIISFSYFQKNRIKTCYLKECVGLYAADFFDDSNILREVVGIVYKFAERILNDSIFCIVIAVPEHCSYIQKKLLNTIVAEFGISIIRIVGSNNLSALYLCNEIYFEENKNDYHMYANFICSIHSGYAELSAFEFENEVVDFLGTTIIRIVGTENEGGIKQLSDRINTEARQFVKDLVLSGSIDSRSTLFLSDYGCFGNVRESFVREFKTLFGLKTIGVERCAAKGALLHAMKLSGYSYSANMLMLCTQNKSISAGLGENGEHTKIIDYYSTIPTHHDGELLVSTETMLNIYEGNYMNRKYDCIIGQFAIPDSLEGHIIMVSVDIDSNNRISISVVDDNENVVLSKTEL